MRNLKDLLVHEIQDLYSAESQLIEALPKMVKTASDGQLKAAFQSHLGETKGQLRRLEQVAKLLGVSPDEVTCQAMKGLVKEAEEAIKEGEEPEVTDAALIGAAQKVEHYEMAGYGTAKAHALRLGLSQIAALLQETLDEEAAANDKLSDLAESGINQDAVAAAAG